MVDPPRVLVVGAGGLVGSHLAGALRGAGFDVLTVKVPWLEADRSIEVLTATVAGLARWPGRWSLVWAAGAGVVATSEDDMRTEVHVFEQVLRSANLASAEAMLLVSSAGAVHAGSAGPPFTEHTPPCPVSAYGHAKLAMEHFARAACRDAAVPLLIARLSNVYGPGQRLDKPQGLVSHIALAAARREPLKVFVSHDTLRDYVYAPDVGRLLAAGLTRLVHEQPEEPVVKIVALGLPATVGHMVAEARRVLHRPLRTINIAGQGAGQVADLRLRSTVWVDLDRMLRTGLASGLAVTAEDVRARLVAAGRDLR